MDDRASVMRPTDVSLAHLLRRRAKAHPDRLAYRAISSGRGPDETLTFGQLDERAQEFAAGLLALGAPGDRVALLLPNGLDFIVSYLGSAYAGTVAVPLSYPVFEHTFRKTAAHVLPMIRSAAPMVTVTTPKALEAIREDNAFGRCGTVADLSIPGAEVDTASFPGREDLCLLQFTSGSTTQPRGVMLTHSNVLHNLAQIAQLGRMDMREGEPQDSKVVSWLPLFHDMGLAMAMFALQVGGGCHLLTPGQFLVRPLSWLEAISEVGAQFSGCPNFGYQHCVDRLEPADRDHLDLSKWELGLNAAEPVRAETVRRFAEFLAPTGYRASTMTPSFGLAEATVFCTGLHDPDDEPLILRLDPDALLEGDVIFSDRPDSVEAVGCGHLPEYLIARIVDPELGVPSPPGRLGEIWLHGENVGLGYWQHPEATQATFGGMLPSDGRAYLRTGDLGFLHDGQLFVAGRLKDLIIVKGQNHQPHDIEHTVSHCHPDIEPRKCAVFTLDPLCDTQLVVAAELTTDAWTTLTTEGQAALCDEIERAVRAAVKKKHALKIDTVALLCPGSIPFTTSGKVQRSLSRQRFVKGHWTPLAAQHA
jgi:acyl-CoA synthetase (AMP-forming)/AMP-acid ligase II